MRVNEKDLYDELYDLTFSVSCILYITKFICLPKLLVKSSNSFLCLPPKLSSPLHQPKFICKKFAINERLFSFQRSNSGNRYFQSTKEISKNLYLINYTKYLYNPLLQSFLVCLSLSNLHLSVSFLLSNFLGPTL